MQNKVVTTVSRAIARLGGMSLRFNYRGVNASHGQFDGERGELEDALAAIAHLRALPGMSHLPLVVAGFSFGGAISYRAALETPTAALVTIAPAHERIPPNHAGSFANWLLVHGNEDAVIPAAGVLDWARQHNPRPRIEQFDGTGHFFHGRLPQLAESVSGYLRETLS
jgi:alpha/beta superfamily hydrolase